MSKFMEAVRKRYTDKKESITKEEYEKAKAQMSWEEFEKSYTSEETKYEYCAYFKIVHSDIQNEEIPLFMRGLRSSSLCLPPLPSSFHSYRPSRF